MLVDLYRVMVDAVADYAIFALDASGNVATWNRGAERIKGYTADEIIGRHFSTFYPSEDVAAGKPAMELVVAARDGRFEDEGWRVRKDGSRLWANVVITALRDADGRLIGFAKVTRDLTSRLAAEEAARRLAAEHAAREEALRSAEEAEALVEQLQSQALELEQQTEEAQALAEELEETNEQLTTALADAQGAAEAALASEARYAALVRAGGKLVWTSDALGRVEDMPEWRALTGQTVEQVRGQGWADAINPADRPAIAAAGLRAYQQKSPYEGEFRVRLADGRERWYRSNAAPVIDDHGEIREWVGTFTDIDDQRRTAERKAFLDAASELLYASFIDVDVLSRLARHCVPFLADYCSVDLLGSGGEIVRVETAHVDPAKEAIVRELWSRFPYRATDTVGAPEVIRTQAPSLMPVVEAPATIAFAKEADQRAMLAALNPRSYLCVPFVARGRAYGALSCVMSDSGRRYGEADLAVAVELAQRVAVAIDNVRLYASERAARADAERGVERVTRLQRLTAALSGAATREEVGRAVVRASVDALGASAGVLVLVSDDGGWLDLVASENVSADTDQTWRRFPTSTAIPAADAVRTRDVVLVRSDAEHRARYPHLFDVPRAEPVRAMAAVPLLADGRAVGAIGLSYPEERAFSDDEVAFMRSLAGLCSEALTRTAILDAEQAARREAQDARAAAEAARAEAEAANLAKTQFLAVMSHELRTPLNAIGGYAELLDMGLRGPVTDEQREDLARIQRSQRHLLALVNDVLNFARVDSGAVQYDLEPVSLAAALSGLESMVAPQMAAKGLAYVYDAPPPTLRVRADAEKLPQIVLNLLSNAIKFTPSGGRVTVRCAEDDGVVRIAVADTGRGIPAEQLGPIFEPFVQVDRGLTRTSEGTGLGLAISRDLARAMGGDLTVESALGAGSTFTLTLPRSD
ncbi:MAG TPA: PAS domain S-box protein [Gemmatimonadaceae bacterium]|nr:PAS domain S-box protein [Gemmatimonadaceae bacterium]